MPRHTEFCQVPGVETPRGGLGGAGAAQRYQFVLGLEHGGEAGGFAVFAAVAAFGVDEDTGGYCVGGGRCKLSETVGREGSDGGHLHSRCRNAYLPSWTVKKTMTGGSGESTAVPLPRDPIMTDVALLPEKRVVEPVRAVEGELKSVLVATEEVRFMEPDPGLMAE